MDRPGAGRGGRTFPSDRLAAIQHDRGGTHDPERWFKTAARAARESGDRQRIAWVLAHHATVGLNYGAPKSAAERAARAQRTAGNIPSAAALASAVTARSLAPLHTASRCRLRPARAAGTAGAGA